jgi:hypothetical protein
MRDDADALRARETCVAVVRFARTLALERGRSIECDASRVHRARLLRLRARLARVRAQPRRARRERCASDGVGALLALLRHAPCAHESLGDDKRRDRGWTGRGMARTGTIRVGAAHQARVEATRATRATFERGKMSEREKRLAGYVAWPRANGGRAKAKARTRARPTGGEGSDGAATANGERAVKTDAVKGEEEDVSNRPGERGFTDEEIAASRAALEEELRRGGADEDSLLGLRTIGAAGAREGWDDEEVAVFAEHATRYGDDLFRLRAKLPKKSMRDVVNYYYNVWQVGFANYGRVDVEGAEEPAPRERARRGPAPKYTVEQVRREKDEKSLRGFVDWIRGVAINTKRAMLNVHRAPTTARVKGHMMTRWRTVTRSEDADDGVAREAYLKDLKRRMTAARFTKEEQEAAARMKTKAKSSKASSAKVTKTASSGDAATKTKKTASAPADGAPTPKKRKRRIDDGQPKICRNCRAMETKQWRLPVEGAGVLCNACGLRDRKQAKKNEASAAGETEPTPKENKTPDRGKDGLKKKRSPGLKPTPDRNFQL